jgi:hypothetical protein
MAGANQTDEIDWQRFSEDKLYRALATSRGLPPPFPVDFEIDLPRFRAEPSYRQMIMTRGVTLTPAEQAESKKALEDFERGWAEAQRADQATQSGQVVKIDDPRFRVRRAAALSAPRR